tara:strand:- start:234 stop:407 length:174 start_codon:yes stop_codon:yes gene_type:complete
MKIKKKFLDNTIYEGGRKIYLSSVMDKNLFDYVVLKYPTFVEEDKPKKKKAANPKVL